MLIEIFVRYSSYLPFFKPLAIPATTLLRPQHLPDLIPQAVLPAIGPLGRRQRPHQAKLTGHAFYPMRGIDILDHGDLVAGRGTLAGDDGRVGEEILPYLEIGITSISTYEYLTQPRTPPSKRKNDERRTLNHRFPYFASTFSLFAIQFLYHRHSVAE